MSTIELTADELRSYIGRPYADLPDCVGCAYHYPLVEDGIITAVIDATEDNPYEIVDDMYMVYPRPESALGQ